MSSADATASKAMFQRLHDAIETHDLELISRTIDEVVEPDVIFHAPVPMEASGSQAMKLIWAGLLRAYPDIQVKVEDLIAEGDRIIARQTVTGTHRGEYMGLPPTGKSVRYNEIFIIRVANGRAAEIWGVVDVLAQMRQLGAVPA